GTIWRGDRIRPIRTSLRCLPTFRVCRRPISRSEPTIRSPTTACSWPHAGSPPATRQNSPSTLAAATSSTTIRSRSRMRRTRQSTGFSSTTRPTGAPPKAPRVIFPPMHATCALSGAETVSNTQLLGCSSDPHDGSPTLQGNSMPAFETLFSSVNRWECDENDHLNVQFYFTRFEEADRQFRLLSGLSDALVGSRRVRHVRYHCEL